jgi:hypothetical protein
VFSVAISRRGQFRTWRPPMTIGIGTIVLIVLIVLIVMMLRRRAV